MKIARIRELRKALDDENISYGELAEIQDAFDKIDPTTLRDLPENALAGDMLDELESRTTLQRYYFDVTTDYGSVDAHNEAEACVLIREMIDRLGTDFEIYEVGDVE